jgi:hypothetical protein
MCNIICIGVNYAFISTNSYPMNTLDISNIAISSLRIVNLPNFFFFKEGVCYHQGRCFLLLGE